MRESAIGFHDFDGGEWVDSLKSAFLNNNVLVIVSIAVLALLIGLMMRLAGPSMGARPALARPLAVAGGVLLAVSAMLPWATFVFEDFAYPEKASLQYFDAPFELTGFRWHLLLAGVLTLVAALAPRIPARGRVLRAIGLGSAAVVVINGVYLGVNGGGLATLTVQDGVSAFGAVVGLVGALVLLLGSAATEQGEIPKLPVDLPRPLAWLVLLVGFAAVLYLVVFVLTAGGQGGSAHPFAGAVFLSILGFIGGVLAALQALGVVGWISKLSEQHRAFSIAVLAAAALALPLTGAGNAYWMTVATNLGVYATTAIGLNVVVGLAGLLDLGYVAFMGIGALVAAQLSGAASAHLGFYVPFPIVAVLAAVVAGIFGAIVGSPTLRVRGDYLAIVTLAFGEIFNRSMENNIANVSNGSNAIPDIPQLDLFGTKFNSALDIGSVHLPEGVLYYILITLVVAVVMGIFANLKNSRIGRAWIAIREDEDAARAMGINTGRAKILAFLVGATLAGLAGAVFAHKNSTVSYESFRFTESVTLLAAVIIGGMGTVPGAVLGASLLFVLPEKLREFEDLRLMLFGVALVLIMRFRPQGLVPDSHRRAELAGEDPEGHRLDTEQVEHQAVKA